MVNSVLFVLLLIGGAYCYPSSNRVVNGTDASRGQYPFMISLRSASGSHSCGGTIISTKWILTAAHCVNGEDPASISIQYGLTTIDVAGPNVAAVKKIFVHERYSPRGNVPNDVALLQLEGRLSINGKTIGILNLPQQDFEVAGGEPGTLVGWGLEKISLRSASGKHSCGGTIISTKWILTAAHCVNGEDPASISIQYGLTAIDVAGSYVAAVKKIFVHERYSPRGNVPNDVALLQLEGRLSINGKTIGILNLPQQGFEVAGGEPGTLVGWGLEKDSGSVQKTLQQVQLKIYSDEECSARHEGQTTVDHICGGVDEGGKGQCNGDSGGPLIHNGTQVGIVSWSIKPCTVAPYPGVYTKVSHYVEWIRNIID